jgi:predicted anti-sigma-YlaC factor YlaD
MNCLSKIEMQLYADKELESALKAHIELHLLNCTTCNKLYESTLKDIKMVHTIISARENKYDFNSEIPTFKLTQRKESRPLHKNKHMFLKIVATLILIAICGTFVIKKNFKKTTLANIDNVSLELNNHQEPNKQWHENQIIMVITDENGEPVHTYITIEKK